MPHYTLDPYIVSVDGTRVVVRDSAILTRNLAELFFDSAPAAELQKVAGAAFCVIAMQTNFILTFKETATPFESRKENLPFAISSKLPAKRLWVLHLRILIIVIKVEHHHVTLDSSQPTTTCKRHVFDPRAEGSGRGSKRKRYCNPPRRTQKGIEFRPRRGN